MDNVPGVPGILNPTRGSGDTEPAALPAAIPTDTRIAKNPRVYEFLRVLGQYPAIPDSGNAYRIDITRYRASIPSGYPGYILGYSVVVWVETVQLYFQYSRSRFLRWG